MGGECDKPLTIASCCVCQTKTPGGEFGAHCHVKNCMATYCSGCTPQVCRHCHAILCTTHANPRDSDKHPVTAVLAPNDDADGPSHKGPTMSITASQTCCVAATRPPVVVFVSMSLSPSHRTPIPPSGSEKLGWCGTARTDADAARCSVNGAVPTFVLNVCICVPCDVGTLTRTRPCASVDSGVVARCPSTVDLVESDEGGAHQPTGRFWFPRHVRSVFLRAMISLITTFKDVIEPSLCQPFLVPPVIIVFGGLCTFGL